jgi:uncharacterized MAPEG superfamily protein
MWVPYILNVILANGLVAAVGYPETLQMAPWAERMKKAHYNGVENLVVFAPLVLVAHAAGVSNETTVMACTVYFCARVVHWLVYTLGIPWLRTLAHAVSWLSMGAIALQLL